MNIRKVITIVVLLFGTMNIMAQEEGTGSVNIQQDQRLQNIVSGDAPVVEKKTNSDNGSHASSSQKTAAPRRVQKTQVVSVSDLPSFGKVNNFDMRRGAKKRMRGFRIQMFWGNSLRTDYLRAKRLGEKVTGAFPELKSYVTFDQPHWRCRVGDFKTRSGAARYLDRMRKIAPEAMIVRSEILIYQ